MILGPDGKPARQNGTGRTLETPDWLKRETTGRLAEASANLRVLELRESVEAEPPARKIWRSDLED